MYPSLYHSSHPHHLALLAHISGYFLGCLTILCSFNFLGSLHIHWH